MSLGSHLLELRQRHGASLEEVARSTRVPARFLAALEADDLSDLPPPPFVKGFIRAYCQVLREPADEPLALYGTVVPAARAQEGRSAAPLALIGAHRRRGPMLASFGLLVVLGFALLAITLVLQSRRGPPAESRVPAIPDREARELPVSPEVARSEPRPPDARVPAVPPDRSPAGRPPREATRPLPPPTSAPAAAVPSVPRAASPAASSPYRLTARTLDTTWMRVRTADGRTTEETIPAGEVREWISNRPFVVAIGNAGGVRLELNGRALPPLGNRGEVIGRLVVPAEP